MNTDRFLRTIQVLWLKKLKIPLSAAITCALTGGASPGDNRRQTQSRRSPVRRRRQLRRRSASRRAFPWYSVRADGEVREQVERAGDEDCALGAGELAGARECLLGVGHGLDEVEERPGDPRELVGVECAGAGRGGGDERAAGAAEEVQHRRRVLVLEDRGDDDVLASRQTREQPLDPGRVVRSGENVLADDVEPPRKRDLDVA